MMCFIFLVYFFSMNTISSAVGQGHSDPLLFELRTNLQKAFQEEGECEKLYEKIKNLENPEPIVKGYMGAIYVARARHITFFKKMKNLNTGIDLLEEAIKGDPKDVELRFLRLTIQVNLPKFLGYHQDVEKDKIFVLENYQNAGPKMKQAMLDFIKTSGEFNEAQRASVGK